MRPVSELSQETFFVNELDLRRVQLLRHGKRHNHLLRHLRHWTRPPHRDRALQLGRLLTPLWSLDPQHHVHTRLRVRGPRTPHREQTAHAQQQLEEFPRLGKRRFDHDRALGRLSAPDHLDLWGLSGFLNDLRLCLLACGICETNGNCRVSAVSATTCTGGACTAISAGTSIT